MVLKSLILVSLLLGCISVVNAQEKDTLSTQQDSVYTFVYDMPEPSEGEAMMYEFLRKNIVLADSFRGADIETRVIVRFIVNEDGKISDAEVLKGGANGLGEEIVRVINLMPAWKVGKHNGKPVKVCMTLPIRIEWE